MKPAIRVENLSKCFRIGPRQTGGYRTLRGSLVEAAARSWHGLRRLWVRARAPARGTQDPALALGLRSEAEEREHWALKEVSFEVRPGEVLGLIGRNGAGKSTLLKVLSRITEPTAGRVELRGRVLSLLEVGTGFHQELTGRENIYLNGAILGMSRREIDRKFDDIVAFAEVEKFLDTPTKRYSSGMYIRLAFAVAAHLDAEILLIDEVLAVGDAAFQKKCLDRISTLARSGGTVIFVSHNMATVASHCKSALVLENGQLVGRGEAREQVQLYLNTLGERCSTDVAERTDRVGNGLARLTEVCFLDGQGRPVESAMGGEPLVIRMGYRGAAPLHNVEVHVWVVNDKGVNVTYLSSRFTGDLFPELPAAGALECRIPELALAPGSYLLNIDVVAGLELVDSVQAVARLEVNPGSFFPTGRTPAPERGVVLTRHNWTLASGGR
jgi:lipopolysaccharide transport system ATP-binding protein